MAKLSPPGEKRAYPNGRRISSNSSVLGRHCQMRSSLCASSQPYGSHIHSFAFGKILP